MAFLDHASREVKVKIVVAGVPFICKEEMLRDFADRCGNARFHSSVIGESRILSAFITNRVPKHPDWKLNLSLHTVAGQADYNAITELLLDNLDGLVFVCPVQSNEAEVLRDSLSLTLFNLRRRGRELDTLPIVMHYREQERLPDFNIAQLETYLGIEPGSRPSFFTAMGEKNNLSESIVAVMMNVLNELDFGEREVA